MTDTTTDPGDPPLVPSPFLTPASIPVLQQFADDLRSLCSAVSLAGATPNMILGELWGMGWMILDGCKDATLAAPAPTPPAPTPPAPTPPAPTPPAPAPVPVASPAPGPVVPQPDWVDAAGQTYADWTASVAAAQQMAANLGITYTPGSTPVFNPPGTGG